MSRFLLYFAAVFAVLMITGACISASCWKNVDSVEFLKSYGWEVKENPIECVEVTIPESFDKVYEDYNEIQLQAGLDLKNYRGKTGIRCTYEVTNYPREVSGTVRANLIIIDNTPVAGDIMTTGVKDGFIRSLQLQTDENENPFK